MALPKFCQNNDLKAHESEPATCRMKLQQQQNTRRHEPNEVRLCPAEILFRLGFNQSSSVLSDKAQYSIVYLLVISGILLFFMGAVFLMSDSFQKTTTEKFGNFILETVTAKVESALIELKILSAGSQNANLTFGIPELIGEQRYAITASNSTIEVRTLGNPSLTQKYNMTFWNASLRGSVFSSKGKAELDFRAADNTITLR